MCWEKYDDIGLEYQQERRKMIQRKDIRNYMVNEDGTGEVKRLCINVTPVSYTLWFFEEATGEPVTIGEYTSEEEASVAFDALKQLLAGTPAQQKDK